jgi:hypothetical protein
MGEHVPLAKKLDAEFSSFASLWRKRPWLAIILVVGVLLVGAWQVYSVRQKEERIAALEAENTSVSTRLRESDRENRGLRETVAPLLARAAREFPGEEINASLKKLLERLEADRVGNRALASATITAEVSIQSEQEFGNHFIDQGGYAGLCVGQEAVLIAESGDSYGNTIAPKVARFRSVFTMPADYKQVGQPLGTLAGAEYMQLEFTAMPENQSILGGKAVIVLNGSVRMEFTIPPQKAVGRRIFIRGVKAAIKALLEK